MLEIIWGGGRDNKTFWNTKNYLNKDENKVYFIDLLIFEILPISHLFKTFRKYNI